MTTHITATDAWHLARVMAGAPRPDLDTFQTDLAWQIMQAMISANGRGPAGGLTDFLSRLDPVTAFAIHDAINSADPSGPEPTEPKGTSSVEQSDCPPLPRDVCITGDSGPPEWLNRYIRFASAVSPMTPVLFHESAGLWLVSAAIARRLRVPMPFGNVYPNLLITWLAQTTLYRKTTALEVARRQARRLFPHLLMAQDSTPEAMIADLAGCEPVGFERMNDTLRDRWKVGRNFAGQRAWLLDETSGLLSGAGRDYNAGQIEMLLRLYDCDPEYTRSTRAQGQVTIRNAYLSLLGASTPAAMVQHLDASRLWAMGFWPRCAILTPEGRPEWCVATDTPEAPVEILSHLKAITDRLPVATYPDLPAAIGVQLGLGVFDAWQQYAKAVSFDLITDELDERLAGSYGRLPTQLLKVATILATLDWPAPAPAPRIEMNHLASATRIVESWRASAHRAIALTSQVGADRMSSRVLRLISASGEEGTTLRDLGRAMRDKTPGEITRTVEDLLTIGEVEKLDRVVGPKGGRPTDRFRVAAG